MTATSTRVRGSRTARRPNVLWVCTDQVVYHERGLGEIYDLQEDPGEFRNLWSSSAHAALRHDLMARSFDATVMAQDWGSPRVAAH